MTKLIKPLKKTNARISLFFTIALLFSLAIFILPVISQAQPDWSWASSAGGSSNDYGKSICSDDNGNIYDQYGGSKGRIDSNGNMYDQYGGSQGRFDNNGNFYDQYGGSQGRIDSNGNMYDQYGGSQGRIDSNGNIYDQYGGSKGRFGR